MRPTQTKTKVSTSPMHKPRHRTSNKIKSGAVKVPSWLHDLPQKPRVLKNSKPSNPPKYSSFQCLKNKLCSLNNVVLVDRQLWVFLSPKSTLTLPDIPFQTGPLTAIDSINLEYEPLPESALDIKEKLSDEPVILLPRFKTLWETLENVLDLWDLYKSTRSVLRVFCNLNLDSDSRLEPHEAMFQALTKDWVDLIEPSMSRFKGLKVPQLLLIPRPSESVSVASSIASLSSKMDLLQSFHQDLQSRMISHRSRDQSLKPICLFQNPSNLSRDYNETLQILKSEFNSKLTPIRSIDLTSSLLDQASVLSSCSVVLTHQPFHPALLLFASPSLNVILLNMVSKLWIQPWIPLAGNITVFEIEFKTVSSKKRKTSTLGKGTKLSILLQIILGHKNKFLMFMPWEQLNNQLIGFKSACAMARILDRVLVTPLLGYRHPLTQGDSTWNFSFRIQDFEWAPLETYFELENTFACQTVSSSHFLKLNQTRMGAVHFNPVARATSHEQLQQYYKEILGLEFDKIIDHPKLSQLTSNEVKELFGQDKSPILALGSLFWTYGFDRHQEYPLKDYVNYMDNLLYSSITSGLRPQHLIQHFADACIQQRIGNRPYLALHIRRGDYQRKCGSIKDSALKSHCFPQNQQVLDKIEHVFSQRGWKNAEDEEESEVADWKEWDEDKAYLYIASNINPRELPEFLDLQRRYSVLTFEDVFDETHLETLGWNPIHKALLDREIGRNATHFIGNFYSSFTRAIVEARDIDGLSFDFF